MRFAPWVAVSACLAAFAGRISETADEPDTGWWLFTRGPVLFAVLAAVTFCAVVAVLRVTRGARTGRQAWPTFGWAVALALLAAIPISFSYDDVSTLMLCLKPRERIPALTSDE